MVENWEEIIYLPRSAADDLERLWRKPWKEDFNLVAGLVVAFAPTPRD